VGVTVSNGGSPPGGSAEIVLYAAEAPVVAGNWRVVADGSAAGGHRMEDPEGGASKVGTALANPSHYLELTFTAEAGVPYHVWVRARAAEDHWGNDSVHLQFSGTVNESGAPIARIGTTGSLDVNLEECGGCGLDGWGWQDNGWGAPGLLGAHVRFATSGPQTVRIQRREDGISIEQIVISSATYLTTAPGPAKRDATIVPR
jgi:hypothetical protein